MIKDKRKRGNGKLLRRSFALRCLDDEENENLFGIHIHEAQISCLISGLDHDSWVAYLFIDTYYQGQESYESVEYYHSQEDFEPDPFTAGTMDSNLPIWAPREYFLTVYECRLKQMRHALHNLVSRLILKLEPYVSRTFCIITHLGL